MSRDRDDPRLPVYAAAQGLSLAAARRRLITLALDRLEASARGGRVGSARLTPEQRRARAAHAAAVREARRR